MKTGTHFKDGTVEWVVRDMRGGGIPLDKDSDVMFSLGCDAGGVYLVTPDETVQGGAE